MQTKSFVSLAPVIADSIVSVKNQRWDIEVLQASRDNQTTMSATHDDDIRVRVHEFHFALSLLLPFSVVREGVPQFSCLFRVFFQTSQARVHGVTFPLSVGGGDQAKNARSETESPHFKGENTLYPSNGHGELHQGCVLEVEGRQVCDLESVVQELFDTCAATEGAEIPGDSEDITPKRIIDKKLYDLCCVSGLDERCKS